MLLYASLCFRFSVFTLIILHHHSILTIHFCLVYRIRQGKDILPWNEIEKAAEKSAIVDKAEVG